MLNRDFYCISDNKFQNIFHHSFLLIFLHRYPVPLLRFKPIGKDFSTKKKNTQKRSTLSEYNHKIVNFIDRGFFIKLSCITYSCPFIENHTQGEELKLFLFMLKAGYIFPYLYACGANKQLFR